MATVFVIDHDQTQLAALHQALAQQGHRVVFAEESGDWLGQARALRPACIVLAVELVGISGYSVCNKIKRDRELGTVPLMLASSQASAETFAEHSRLRTHADAYAHKPYDVGAVVQTIAGMVASAADGAPDAMATQEAPEPQAARPAPARRAARFGEEPSVVDVSADPFLRGDAPGETGEPRGAHAHDDEQTHGATGAQARPATAQALDGWGESEATETSDAGQPSGGAGARSTAPVAFSAARPHATTDASILLERAVDTQTQTRVYDDLLPSQAQLPRGPSPAELINAALGDLDAAAQQRAEAAEVAEAQAAAVRHVDVDARVAQLEGERDRALAERDGLLEVLTQLRQLLAAAQH